MKIKGIAVMMNLLWMNRQFSCRIAWLCFGIIFLTPAISSGQSDSTKFLNIECVQEIPFLKGNKVEVDDMEGARIFLVELYNLALQESYLAFSIDSIYRNNNEIYAQIYLGSQYQFDQVSILMEDSIGQDRVREREMKLLSESNNFKEIFSTENDLLRWYENNGYPFAKIYVDEISSEEKAIAIKLDPGTPYNIDSLIIKGEDQINPRIILNRIGIRIGDSYDESKVQEIANKVGDINHISLERNPEVLFSRDKSVLYLFLKKKANNRINALIGLLPDEDGKVQFTGNFELQLSNALGADEFLEFNWRRLEEGTQDLKINFSYPYIFNLKAGIEQNLSIYKHDTTYTEVKARTSLQYLFNRYNFLRFFVQSRTYNSLQNTTDEISDPESSIIQFGIGGQYSKLDYRFNPRKGIDTQVDFALGDKKLQGVVNTEGTEQGQNRQLSVEGYFSYYQPLAKRSVLKSSLNFAHIENDFIIENELYRLGGIKSIRGFDEEAFNASSLGIATVEYRYLTDQNSYFSIFTDYAQYEKKTIQSEDILRGSATGIGMGAAFETKAGIFSLSYALGRLDQDAFLIRSGKVHFGFNALF